MEGADSPAFRRGAAESRNEMVYVDDKPGLEVGWAIRRLAQPLPYAAVNFGSRDPTAPPTQLRNLLNLPRRGPAVQQFQG